MVDIASTYFSVFGSATECIKHMQEATLSDSYISTRFHIVTGEDPGSVSHMGVSGWLHLLSSVTSKN